MAVTNYYTVNGRIRGESTSGTRTNYLHDALGSVTATANESGTVVNTYRYKPYGARLSKTGAGADPKFQWVGQHGYRTNSGLPFYVRARHYSGSTAAWSSVDRYWPRQAAYGYPSNPTETIDPLGTYPRFRTRGSLLSVELGHAACEPDLIEQVKAWCDKINRAPNGGVAEKYIGSGRNPSVGDYIDEINDCIKKSAPRGINCGSMNSNRLECMRHFCENGWIFCTPAHVNDPDSGFCSIKKSKKGHNEPWSYGTIVMNDPTDFTSDKDTENWGGLFLHELMHACGIQHGGVTHGDPGTEVLADKHGIHYNEFCNNVFACCIAEAVNHSGKPQGRKGGWNCTPKFTYWQPPP